MKLMIVAPYFYPKIGGMENYAWNIGRRLKQIHKWDTIVITTNHEEKKYKEEVIDGIKIYRLPTLIKISNTPINPFWYFTMSSIIEKEKPTIINGHTPVPFISDLAAVIALKKKTPFFLTYQNDLTKSNILLNLIIKIYYYLLGFRTGEISNAIIASSREYVKKSFFLSKFSSKVSIIPPGVDIDFFDKAKIILKISTKYKNDHVVLFVGQLDKTHEHKGLSILIEAFSKVQTKDKNAKLIVIGNGNMIDKYKEQVKKLRIDYKVEFKTKVNNEELVSFYKVSNLVVLPSISNAEGFGMVLIEAGACKKPVIGSDIGGISSVIDSKNGILVKPNSVDELSNSIIKLLYDKNLSEELGKNGHSKVVNEFNWDMLTEKSKNLFESKL